MRIIVAPRVPAIATPVHFSPEEGNESVRVGKNKRELVLGLGPYSKLKERQLHLLPRRIIMLAKEKKARAISFNFREFQFPHLQHSPEKLAELLAVNALMANFSFTHFKTPPKSGFPKVETLWLTHASGPEIARGLRRGKLIGEAVNRARHISTMPGGDMTPDMLADHARETVRDLPVEVEILGVHDMEALKMGGVLAVGKGSQSKPRFIILDYRGGDPKDKPTVLIGKGVTFDTGGINLKPSDSILGMNMDMSGGAAVIHTLALAARLKLKKNIIALIPAVENMPSGESYRPGDIIRSFSGKTIEVQNTDAEGRIILADALGYARRYKPSLVIDVATLTGSAVVALGERASALFTENEELERTLRHIGEEVGDFVWPLPLWDEYAEDIKGNFGDIGNVGGTKWGGAITAALFLKQFVRSYEWVHLDIAPRMTTHKGEFLELGGAGATIRLLIRYLAML